MGGFDVSSLTANSIELVELIVHFDIPNALVQDKARFSVIDGGTYDLVKTWSNTQSGLYYMNSGWSIEINNQDNWTWSELANLEIDLDYVSNGGTDDSATPRDAVGLKITMRTPWYGAERVVASSSFEFKQLANNRPRHNLRYTEFSIYRTIGLDSDGGTWTTDLLEKSMPGLGKNTCRTSR